jgi:ferredoxin/flavodoxin
MLVNMKKVILFYNSYTGNTKLACEKVASLAGNADFDLRDCVHPGAFTIDDYDMVGFATFTDYWGPHSRILQFIESIQYQNKKPAFILNTSAGMNGKTLPILRRAVSRKGFRVFAGFSLNAPENYPPLVAAGKTHIDNPDPKNLDAFYSWIKKLDLILSDDLRHVKKISMPYSPLWNLIPVFPRTFASKFIGRKQIDVSRCNNCGQCVKGCAFGAISMSTIPYFDEDSCMGCFACYNRCPVKAIYTRKLRDKGHYPQPDERYRMLLS